MGSHGGEMGAIASLTVITTLHWTSVSFGSMSVVEPCEVDFLSMASNHICVAALRFNKTVIFIYVIEVSFFFCPIIFSHFLQHLPSKKEPICDHTLHKRPNFDI